MAVGLGEKVTKEIKFGDKIIYTGYGATKGKKLPTYLGRAKEKRKNRDKRIGMGPAPLGGSCEGGKVSTH